MSISPDSQVEFTFGDRHLIGRAVGYEAAGDIAGPDGYLLVDVDGLRYRVRESEADRPQ